MNQIRNHRAVRLLVLAALAWLLAACETPNGNPTPEGVAAVVKSDLQRRHPDSRFSKVQVSNLECAQAGDRFNCTYSVDIQEEPKAPGLATAGPTHEVSDRFRGTFVKGTQGWMEVVY
jgi:hypothetical protein